MIQIWFDARGAMGRGVYGVQTTLTWLIGHLGFLAYFLASTETYSFTAFGHLISDHGAALSAIEMTYGWPAVGFVAALWFAEIWALLVMSAKRLRDAGKPEWLAGLALLPGVGGLVWLALCLMPRKAVSAVQAV